MKEMNFNKTDHYKNLNKLQSNITKSLNEMNMARSNSDERKRNEEISLLENSVKFNISDLELKRRHRLNETVKQMEYFEKTSLVALTEMVSQVVEASLLFDVEKYAESNPEYKADIREAVKTILESSEINQSVSNANTGVILEHVAKSIPSLEVGILLTEETIKELVKTNVEKEITDAISELKDEVIDKVVEIVEDEQERAEKIETDITKVEDIKKLSEANNLRVGLIEALAINDAKTALNEGKTYDSGSAVANAMLYVTILETLDVMDLVPSEDIDDAYVDIKKTVNVRDEKVFDSGKSKEHNVESIAALHGVSEDTILAQINIGKEIEKEHTDREDEAIKIAMDHLVEFPDYYTRLVDMENEAEAELKDSSDEMDFDADHPDHIEGVADDASPEVILEAVKSRQEERDDFDDEEDEDDGLTRKELEEYFEAKGFDVERDGFEYLVNQDRWKKLPNGRYVKKSNK